MCGISGYVCCQSTPNAETLIKLLKHGEKRGGDGFGLIVYNQLYRLNYPDNFLNYEMRTKGIPSDYNFLNEYIDNNYNIKVQDVFLANHRAAPETESYVDEEDLIRTTQPIVDTDEQLVLVHNGSVSNFIVDELKKDFKFNTNIDSEAIIKAYIKFERNMQKTMEYLSGGFAFLLLDAKIGCLYAVCSHNPLYIGYVRGCGYFFSSVEDAIWNVVSELKGIPINKNTINMWEDYYAHRIQEYTITKIDLQSHMVSTFPFEPRYVTLNYDPYKKAKKNDSIVLVAASGGLDSSTTLAVLKEAEMNPVAVHFKYGHRGQEAENLAIKAVTRTLDIPLVEFDIEDNMKKLDAGMLTDPASAITTGTVGGLKTTAAWTCFRNHFFLTYLGALAESKIMKENYSKVYITGGYLQLTESGCIIDCADNTITKANGDLVEPRDVKVGDKLLSCDLEGERNVTETIVEKVFETLHDGYLKIVIKSKNGRKRAMLISKTHPVFVCGYGFLHGQYLMVGDMLYTLTRDNHTLLKDECKITAIEEYIEDTPMLNYYCEPHNMYFLNGALVHNSYPDNSERFLDAALKFFKYSICGNRIAPLYGLCNILKTEQYYLLEKLGYYRKLGRYLISCDRPKVVNGLPCNCYKEGKPACGSGLLSYWACNMAGLPDLRSYYSVMDKEYKAYEIDCSNVKNMNIENIINRIELPELNRSILLTKLAH